MVVKSKVTNQGLNVKQGERYRVLQETRNTYVICNALGHKASLHKELFKKCHWLWNLVI